MEKYYRHFKGGLYRLIGLAKDSETLEDIVVYQALYGDKQMWTRPAQMFFSLVQCENGVVHRFEEISEEEAKKGSRMTYKGFTFKYFRGEQQNPFTDKDENAAMWWSGEKLFYDSISQEPGDDFIKNITERYENALTYNDTSDIHRNPSLSKKEHILLYYLDIWHGKWFPYENWDVINQY